MKTTIVLLIALGMFVAYAIVSPASPSELRLCARYQLIADQLRSEDEAPWFMGRPNRTEHYVEGWRNEETGNYTVVARQHRLPLSRACIVAGGTDLEVYDYHIPEQLTRDHR